MTSKTNILNKRLMAILVLGFASGLPLTLIGPTLQAWFTAAHVNVVTIGALSLVGLPYILKFLWAPVMDRFSLFWLGRRKAWIFLMQMGLMITLIALANMDPKLQASWMGFVALLVAFFSASQDVAITAYQTDILTEKERGLGASYYIFTYRIAVLVGGGLALVMADYIGWTLTYEIMAGLLALSILFTYMAPKEDSEATENSLAATIKFAILDLTQRKNIGLLLLVIFFYKFGDAMALSLITNFLMHGLGFTLTEIGIAYKTVSFVATILGAFIGGLFLTRMPLYTALLVFGLAQAFSNLMFVWLALAGKSFLLMTSAIFIENFCSGLSTAALLAFLMSLCNHHYTATQFALFSAIASFGRVMIGPLAGLMVQSFGWAQFFIWSFLLCFPGIVFLLMLKNKVYTYAAATE